MAAARGRGQEGPLARAMAKALCNTNRPVTLILADRDSTAVAFEEAWKGPAFRDLHGGGRVRTIRIPTASHRFARPEDAEAQYPAVRNMMHHKTMG